MVPAVSFQPELQPVNHLCCPIWLLNNNFNRIVRFVVLIAS
jgi:hypothetical protein